MNSDHKPNLRQSDLVYWVYVINLGHRATTAVLPADRHSLWAACE